MKKRVGIKPKQPSLFGDIIDDVDQEVKDGIQLRDEAMAQAIRHAETVTEGWARSAFTFLVAYIRVNYKFTTEEVRIAAEGKVEVPPDTRAWGGIIMQAAKAGFIKKIGVKNGLTKQCHHAPKTVWQVADIFFHKASASEGDGTKTKKTFTLKEMIDLGNFIVHSKNGESLHKYFSEVYGIDITPKQATKTNRSDK